MDVGEEWREGGGGREMGRGGGKEGDGERRECEGRKYIV